MHWTGEIYKVGDNSYIKVKVTYTDGTVAYTEVPLDIVDIKELYDPTLRILPLPEVKRLRLPRYCQCQ